MLPRMFLDLLNILHFRVSFPNDKNRENERTELGPPMIDLENVALNFKRCSSSKGHLPN